MAAPIIVENVIAFVNRGDTNAFLDLFAADGEVDDWGTVYRGRNEIRTWSDRELIGAKARFTLQTASEKGDVATMVVQVGGDGFNGPSRFTFSTINGQIRRMQITAD